MFQSAQLTRIERELDILLRHTLNIEHLETIAMADFSKLEASLTSETSVITGAVTLLGTLSGMIADLKAVASDPTVQAHIDQLAAAVDANKATLAAALAANTPAAPAPVQEPLQVQAPAVQAAPAAATEPVQAAPQAPVAVAPAAQADTSVQS